MKVSIVVIVYNTGQYLERCLDSLINQTYKDIEIIIVDDGSTDNSPEIINNYELKDKRIKVVRQNNKGCVLARTNGVKAATGKYCLFIDSDDWIEYNAVEELVKKMQSSNVDMIKFRAINEPSKVVQESIINGQDTIFEENEKEKIYSMLIMTTKLNNVWNEMIKTELFNTSNPFLIQGINQGDDFLINLDLFYRAKKVLFTNDIYYHYFNNSTSITRTIELHKKEKSINDLIYIYSIQKKYLSKFGMDKNKEIIKNLEFRNLNTISNQIAKILPNKKMNKEYLIKLQNNLKENGLYDVIKNISKKEIKDKNLIRRFIKLNIINKSIEKCYKYRYIVKLYMVITKL